MSVLLCVESVVSGIAAGVVIASALSIFALDFLREFGRPVRQKRIEPTITLSPAGKAPGRGNGSIQKIELRLHQNRMQLARIKKAIAYYKKHPNEKLKRQITLAMEMMQSNLVESQP